MAAYSAVVCMPAYSELFVCLWTSADVCMPAYLGSTRLSCTIILVVCNHRCTVPLVYKHCKHREVKPVTDFVCIDEHNAIAVAVIGVIVKGPSFLSSTCCMHANTSNACLLILCQLGNHSRTQFLLLQICGQGQHPRLSFDMRECLLPAVILFASS